MSAEIPLKTGFSGTSQGMTELQLAVVRQLLVTVHLSPDDELHHGDCVGADREVHDICHDLGIRTISHPPKNHTKRAFTTRHFSVRGERPYLERNRAIVDECYGLLAAPGSPEMLRSGTWATVRYARKKGVPISIVWPDGTVTLEGPGT